MAKFAIGEMLKCVKAEMCKCVNGEICNWGNAEMCKWRNLKLGKRKNVHLEAASVAASVVQRRGSLLGDIWHRNDCYARIWQIEN